MATIYHIAFTGDWEAAQRTGQYTISTRGKTLAEQGFIHAGTEHQVAPVANMIYKDAQDLVVLAIDTGKLTSEIKYDSVPGWDDPFPHIYGPLNADAVIEATPLVQNTDGTFAFSV